jgi:Arc/MetJ-type ribon-helix-helix transcriptional regulator
MKVELAGDTAQWVEREIASGRFPSAEDAVVSAVHHMRLTELRSKLDGAIAEGGSLTTADVRRKALDHLESSNSNTAT